MTEQRSSIELLPVAEVLGRVEELLKYDAQTGIFTWKINRNHMAPAGSEAGYLNNRGYISLRLMGKTILTHRLAWLIMYGEWPDGYLDHINGNKADNRISNLRIITRQENQQNSKLRHDNTSGFRGVTWCSRQKQWRAMIKVNGIRHSLGFFANKDEAIRARQRGEIEHYQSLTREQFPLWRTVESAPMDGSEALFYVPGLGMGLMVLYWMDGYWREKANGLGLKVQPTHWMQLPAFPSAPITSTQTATETSHV